MQTIELKTAPELKRIINAAFPSYKKQKAWLSAFTGKENISSYWDGGSRSEYALVELATMRRMSVPSRLHPYYDVASKGLANQETDVIETDHVGNVYLKVLPEGFALIEAGTFCGKPATAHVFLNPANMPKYLSA